MQGRNVGESYHPLGVGGEWQGREFVEVVHHAVSAAGAEYGAYLGVGECGGEVEESLVVGTAEVSEFAEGVWINHRLVAQLFQYLGGRVNRGRLDGACRGENSNFVALFERRRVYGLCHD